jgi:hypothetical protein
MDPGAVRFEDCQLYWDVDRSKGEKAPAEGHGYISWLDVSKVQVLRYDAPKAGGDSGCGQPDAGVVPVAIYIPHQHVHLTMPMRVIHRARVWCGAVRCGAVR